MKKAFSLICVLLFFSNSPLMAQKKWQLGVGAEVFQTQINNVDRENFSGLGHSFPGFKQNDKLGIGMYGIARIPLYKGLGIETGIGLIRYQSQFHFEYLHSFSQQWINKKFNIGLNYLKLPLNLYYDFRVSKRSSIIFSGGVNIKLLLWTNDNFNKIVFEKIGLPKAYKRYEPFVFAYSGNLSYRYTCENKNSFEIGLTIGRDSNAMVKNNPQYPENFGFYANLNNATYTQYGISLKYFFNL